MDTEIFLKAISTFFVSIALFTGWSSLIDENTEDFIKGIIAVILILFTIYIIWSAISYWW